MHKDLLKKEERFSRFSQYSSTFHPKVSILSCIMSVWPSLTIFEVPFYVRRRGIG